MILQQTFKRQVVHLEIEACKITMFLCGYLKTLQQQLNQPLRTVIRELLEND